MKVYIHKTWRGWRTGIRVLKQSSSTKQPKGKLVIFPIYAFFTGCELYSECGRQVLANSKSSDKDNGYKIALQGAQKACKDL